MEGRSACKLQSAGGGVAESDGFLEEGKLGEVLDVIQGCFGVGLACFGETSQSGINVSACFVHLTSLIDHIFLLEDLADFVGVLVQLLLAGLLLQETDVHLQSFLRIRQQDQLGLEGLFELRELVWWLCEVLVDKFERCFVELLVVVASLGQTKLLEDLCLCLRGREGFEAVNMLVEVELLVICGFSEVQALEDNLEDVLILGLQEQIELDDSLKKALEILRLGFGYQFRKLYILKNEGKIVQFLLILNLQFFLNSLTDNHLLAQHLRPICFSSPDLVPAEILQLKQPLQSDSQVLQRNINPLHVFSQRFFSFPPGDLLEIIAIDAIIGQFLKLGPVAQNGISLGLIICGLLEDEEMVLLNDVLEQLINQKLIRSFLFLQSSFDGFQAIHYGLLFCVSRGFGDYHAETAQKVIAEGFRLEEIQEVLKGLLPRYDVGSRIFLFNKEQKTNLSVLCNHKIQSQPLLEYRPFLHLRRKDGGRHIDDLQFLPLLGPFINSRVNSMYLDGFTGDGSLQIVVPLACVKDQVG